MKNPQNILITGASSGIGEAIAVAYAKKGVKLYLSGRNQERLDKVVELCKDKGAEVFVEIIDVADKNAMFNWVIDCDAKSELDLVIANAGISKGSMGGDESPEQTYSIFDTNIGGVLNTVLPIIDIMKNRGRGQIAIMSSIASYKGLPSAPAYSASKSCIRTWGEALRGQLAKFGVEVSVICPGFVKSRITDANTCPMPFIMPADKAANIIKDRLEKNWGKIVFPWQMAFVMWLLGALPCFITDELMKRLPDKN